jgi:hypothetical protein
VSLEGDGIRLRRARADDVDFLVELLTHEEVEPFLAAIRARDPEPLLEEIERSNAEPLEFGRFVVEVEDDGAWRRAGLLGFEQANRRSRIANLGSLAGGAQARWGSSRSVSTTGSRTSSGSQSIRTFAAAGLPTAPPGFCNGI